MTLWFVPPTPDSRVGGIHYAGSGTNLNMLLGVGRGPFDTNRSALVLDDPLRVGSLVHVRWRSLWASATLLAVE